MLKKEYKLIVTFFTSSAAMATEKFCKEKNIDGKLISAPRNLSSDCGISYATSVSNRDKLIELLKEKNIEYEKMVDMEI